MDAIEGDFCGHGVHSVVRDVLLGVKSPTVLWKPLRGICITAGPHSDRCVKLFHHCHFRVPRAVAIATINALCEGRYDRGRVGELILKHVANDAAALSLVAETAWSTTAHFSCAAAHIVAAKAAPPTLFVKLMVHLPRRLVIAAELAADTAADEAALRVIDGYRAWLQGHPKPVVAHRDDWRGSVLVASKRGLTHRRLPVELIELVLSYVAHSPGVHSDELPLS